MEEGRACIVHSGPEPELWIAPVVLQSFRPRIRRRETLLIRITIQTISLGGDAFTDGHELKLIPVDYVC